MQGEKGGEIDGIGPESPGPSLLQEVVDKLRVKFRWCGHRISVHISQICQKYYTLTFPCPRLSKGWSSAVNSRCIASQQGWQTSPVRNAPWQLPTGCGSGSEQIRAQLPSPQASGSSGYVSLAAPVNRGTAATLSSEDREFVQISNGKRQVIILTVRAKRVRSGLGLCRGSSALYREID